MKNGFYIFKDDRINNLRYYFHNKTDPNLSALQSFIDIKINNKWKGLVINLNNFDILLIDYYGNILNHKIPKDSPCYDLFYKLFIKGSSYEYN
jgi:hypothetical protein